MGLNENHKGDREWDYSNSIYETFKDVDAALFLTEWNEFASLNWEEISKMMRQPSWVFDTRSIVDMDLVKENGINIWQVGYGN